MLRVGILETEEVAKDIIFTLGVLLQDHEWSFQYFTKISEFAKVEAEKTFHMVVFHEKFDVPRVNAAFVLDQPQRIVLFTTTQKARYESEVFPYQRIFYLNRRHVKDALTQMVPYLNMLLKNQEEYFFSYNSISVPLKISDIIFIEKDNKNLVYHTKRGEFCERKSMKEAMEYFEKYRFLRIHTSYLVNLQYITKFETDTVYVQNIALPFARARRQEVIKKVKIFTKHPQ